MAAVAFHFNVPSRRDHAARLLRKAYRSGARVAVTGDAALLTELDRQLWLMDPLEFIPHWRGESVAALPARLAATPIVLLRTPSPQSGHTVLVNLGETLVPGWEHFERVIEVVGRSEPERAEARQRWRAYKECGVSIEQHEVQS
ncbi:MAG: hypothetical protein RJA44_1621 [Pseudomonadota bacterium]|jgi:DNA polymerase-3 subunit chi